MGARFRLWRQQIKQHPVRTVLMALLAVVVVLVILSILGYIFNWEWTGLNATDFTSTPHNITRTISYQPGKTLWDWLQLLIIPAVLAVAGYVINLTISRNEQAAIEQRAKSEREAIEKRAETEREAIEKRAETEREIALDNQREAAFQTYLDRMSELALNKKLYKSNGYEVINIIARQRTLTVLPRLDGKRRGSVLLYLYGSGLIWKNQSKVKLTGADFRETDLEWAELKKADLSGVNMKGAILAEASLKEADLSNADLRSVILAGADLEEANLRDAILTGADMLGVHMLRAKLGGAGLNSANLKLSYLKDAVLYYADLEEADLSNTHLEGANLEGADLKEANLAGADLTGADLSKAKLKGVTGITVEELEKQVKSLKGAIMPDGKMYHNSSGVSLSGAYLSNADLSGVDLSGADLSGADLSNVLNLSKADLSGARYNKNEIQNVYFLGNPNPVNIRPTQWPQEFDDTSKEKKGLICIDC